MFPTIIPEPFAGVLAAYATCFQARSYLTFQWLVLGWVQCLERRTLTAVALASGAVGVRHISVFHRYGRPVTPHVWTATALWYQALRDQPVRLVVVRDPTGKRQDDACFCTD